ncbi:hypothetical protein [Methanobrevibacter sp.]|uniref:hypothetical protein n=1 Tax=Methanobrevibacter sp. TaxID=66852 RepID=UPI002E7709D2|nr:hypothetical protein [Methanobrevibacter sp.]MEE1335945.1 hypothetical protein [Methanobrevibacter sp.]
MPRSVNVINTAPIKLFMGDIMDISKKLLLTLLAIFCVIASAGAACAADAYGDAGYDELGYTDDIGEWVGSQYSDDNQTGWAGSQYNDTDQGGYAGSQYDEDDQGGYAGNQYNEDDQGGYAGSQYNETLENAAANAAAGEPVSDSVSQNMTANATSSHTMLETGNPILALLAVGAVLGSCAVLKRK